MVVVVAVALLLSITAVITQVVDHVERSSLRTSAAAYLRILADTQHFYSREIVGPAKKNGVVVRRDFADHPYAIPFPATFMHGLTESLTAAEDDRSFRFFSRYPFFQRPTSGPQNAFERDALAYFERRAAATSFSRVEEVGGERLMHYAVAVRMSEGCVACHNAHPDSPKTDWKVGEVRGVQAISKPVKLVSAWSVTEGGPWLLILCGITAALVITVAVTVVLLAWRQIDLRAANEDLRRSSLKQIELERSNAKQERKLTRERAEAEKLELQLANEKEKMQLQRRFVAMVSHEFRTPLSVIDGQARSILRRLDRIDPDSIAGRLGRITANVQRLIGLMESMLASARLEAGAIEFSPMEHDLRALIEDVCGQQNEVSESHEIVMDLDALPTTHLSDPHLLRQVFTNLLSNAVKYSPDADRVDVTASQSTDGYRIAVRDYGVGIPEDELPKLATQFFRASTSVGIAGTGIGLNLAKAFAEMHDGSLSVESTSGAGTTFTVLLPSAIAVKAA